MPTTGLLQRHPQQGQGAGATRDPGALPCRLLALPLSVLPGLLPAGCCVALVHWLQRSRGPAAGDRSCVRLRGDHNTRCSARCCMSIACAVHVVRRRSTPETHAGSRQAHLCGMRYMRSARAEGLCRRCGPTHAAGRDGAILCCSRRGRWHGGSTVVRREWLMGWGGAACRRRRQLR